MNKNKIIATLAGLIALAIFLIAIFMYLYASFPKL